MKFSYSAIWDDTAALLKRHAGLAVPLAGVFLFLPALLIGRFLPHPMATDAREFVRLMLEYASANWHWLLLQNLLNMAGTLAILFLVFVRSGITVAGAIRAALLLLPAYFLASLLGRIGIGIGLALFILPGLYLFARLVPLAPAMVAEGRGNPIDGLTRALALSRGRGWAILGLIALVFIAGMTLMWVVNGVLGMVLLFAAGEDLGRLLSLVVGSASAAALTVVMTLLYAAIYRALAGEGAAAAATSGI